MYSHESYDEYVDHVLTNPDAPDPLGVRARIERYEQQRLRTQLREDYQMALLYIADAPRWRGTFAQDIALALQRGDDTITIGDTAYPLNVRETGDGYIITTRTVTGRDDVPDAGLWFKKRTLLAFTGHGQQQTVKKNGYVLF